MPGQWIEHLLTYKSGLTNGGVASTPLPNSLPLRPRRVTWIKTAPVLSNRADLA